MYKKRKSKSTAGIMRNLNTVNGPKIESFGQHYEINDVNPLGQNPGALVFAQNVEWLRTTSGVIPLQTMRGSTLYLNLRQVSFIGATFFNVSDVDYAVWHNESGELRYYTAPFVYLIKSSLSLNKVTSFVNYNEYTSPVVYGANEDDGIYKVDSSFAYSSISADPVSCLCYSGTSKRLFKSYKNIVEYSEQQLLSGTTQLETFGASSNFTVGVNDAQTITEITDDGKIVWFWMDSGIWGLLNPDDPDPTNWIFPKAVSDVGTLSKKTIAYVKYNNRPGYIFLATDRTLRFFTAELTANTGTVPILKDYGSINISNAFSSLLKTISDDNLSLAVGTYVDSKYILNFKGELEVNTCICLDMEKVDSLGSPFWCYVTDQNNTHYARNSKNDTYAFNYGGWISKIFVENTYYRELPHTNDAVYSDDIIDGSIRKIAIPWKFNAYYLKSSETLSKLFDLIVLYKTGGYYGMTMDVSSVSEGGTISDPKEISDLTVEILPSDTSNSYYDISLFDVGTYSGLSAFNYRNTGAQISGNYYSFGFKNSNINQWATIFNIQSKLQLMSSSVMTNNF